MNHNTSSNDSKYKWSVYGGTILGANNTSKVIIKWGPIGSGILFIEQTNQLTNCNSKDSITIKISAVSAIAVNAGDDKSLCNGEMVQLGSSSPASGGVPPYKYKWEPSSDLDNDTIPNPVASPMSTITYKLTVTDTRNVRSSDFIQVTVSAGVKIFKHIKNVFTCLNSRAIFRINAKGEDLTYQWKKDGAEITGAFQDSLVLNSVSGQDEGRYEVIVLNNICQSAYIENAILAIAAKSVITKEQVDQTVPESMNTEFSILINSSNETYQWRKDNNNLFGQNNPILRLNRVKQSDSGFYNCVINSDCGTVTSRNSRLSVLPLKNQVLYFTSTNVDFNTVLNYSKKDTILNGFIKSLGTEDITLNEIKIQGNMDNDFVITNPKLPQVIKKKDSLALAIRFSPTSAGLKFASLQFVSSAPLNPTVNLMGTSGMYSIVPSSNSMKFISKEKNKTVEKIIYIENQGHYLTDVTLSIKGADASNFSIKSPFGKYVLAPGAGLSVTIIFTPSEKTIYDAIFSIITLQNSQSSNVSLTGELNQTSIADEIFNDVNIYPNPTNGKLNIEAQFGTKANVEIQISNVLGQEVFSLKKAYTDFIIVQADLDLVPVGIYMIKISSGCTVYTKEIIKE